jgi:predicted amidohydrolase YtcJ
MQKIISFLSLFLFSNIIFSQKKEVDIIVKNAKIYTVDNLFSIANEMAIANGNIIAVGKKGVIQNKYWAAKVIDVKGKTIYPGFYDPHSHFINLGQMLGQCDLVGSKSFAEVIEKVKAFEKIHPDNKWIIGRGWDQNDWKNKEFPSKKELDIAFPNKPVYLDRIDGHAALVNSRALELAAITVNSKIEGGDYEVVNGQLTGILVDNAKSSVEKVMPIISEFDQRKSILRAEAECLKYGLTTISDAGISIEEIELLKKMHADNSLKIRDYAMVSASDYAIDYFTKNGILKTERLNVRSFKIYADGALGSRGACLLKPYADEPSKTGFLLTSANQMKAYFQKIEKTDFQANTHCIGDSANRLVLDLYGDILKIKNNRRWRIEHSQIVDKTDLPKFGQFSIIPSVQATHATSDMYWAGARLGKMREKNAYTFNDLIKSAGLIANGSDFPVEFVNPLFSFHSAISRQDAQNFPKAGYQIENAITRKEALKAMTIWAAYSNFEEKERGSLEIGKMADFVILNSDIMLIDKTLIRKTKVLATYIGGEKVYGK